jgi:hypothetical protein
MDRSTRGRTGPREAGRSGISSNQFWAYFINFATMSMLDRDINLHFLLELEQIAYNISPSLT